MIYVLSIFAAIAVVAVVAGTINLIRVAQRAGKRWDG